MNKLLKRAIVFGVSLVMIGSVSYAQEAVISGKIVGKDSGSQPVAGASVRILNTSLGTSTDDQGNFSLKANPGKYILYITAVGYADREESIDVGATGTETLLIELPESAIELDDIVVTAQKEEDDLQNISYSISALSSRKVNEYRIWNSKDITAIAPNLYSSNPGDNRNVTSIRGITTTSYDPAVATYIDGVNQFGLDTYIAPLFDVERIEVLRGPQGTLYGRNAMGGVINIITKRPTNQFSGFAEANIGSYGQQRYTIGLRQPLVKDKLYFGFSGMYDRTNGFYTNEFDNSDFDKKHSIAANAYLTWLLNPEWSFTLNVKQLNHRNKGAFTLAISPEDAFDNPFKVNQDAVTEMIDNTFNTSLSINHTGRVVSFNSLTTYQSNYKYYEDPIDADFSPADVISIVNNYGKDWNKVSVFTQEFKVSSPIHSESPLKWTGGVYLFTQDNPVKQGYHFGEFGEFAGGPPNSTSLTTTKGKNKGVAVYGQATYSVTPKTELTLGVRYDYEHKELSSRGDFQMDPDPTFYETQADTSATVSYGAFSPKLGLSYHLSEDHHLYGIYSRGFRTGGQTQYSGDPTQPPFVEYKPEYSNNVEVGMKNTFLNNRLNINVAAFYVLVKDIQVPTLILPSANTVTRNAGELTSLGAEVEISATPVKGLQIDYNFGLTDATYDELELPVQQENGDKIPVDFSGNKQLFTPKATSMLAAQYSLPIASWQALKLVVRGEWMYLGEQYFDLQNNIRQSPYSLLNARLGVSASSFEVMFWGRNLTDKRYISYAYDFGGTRLGDPLNWGVTLRKTF